MKKILFLDILSGDKKIKERTSTTVYRGISYGESVRRFSGISKNDFFEIDASQGRFPDIARIRMVFIGGSVENPVRGSESVWMKKTYAFIRKLKKENIPILGICGGLQFTVRALNGDIVENKNGRDFGNTRITLTKKGVDDYLFCGVKSSFMSMESHRYMVKEMLPGWMLLGSSEKTRIEAIGIGERIRLLQFHPEMRVSHIRAIGRMRMKALEEEGFGGRRGVGNFLSSIRSTDAVGRKIVRNFIRQWDGSLQTPRHQGRLKK